MQLVLDVTYEKKSKQKQNKQTKQRWGDVEKVKSWGGQKVIVTSYLLPVTCNLRKIVRVEECPSLDTECRLEPGI